MLSANEGIFYFMLVRPNFSEGVYLAALLLLSFCCVTHLYVRKKRKQGKSKAFRTVHYSFFTVYYFLQYKSATQGTISIVLKPG